MSPLFANSFIICSYGKRGWGYPFLCATAREFVAIGV